MEKIPVIWAEGIVGADEYSAQFAHEGVTLGRSRYACCGLLNECLDQYNCEHYSGWNVLPHVQEAVVVIHGGHLRYQVAQINEKIAQLEAVLCIGIGDEEQDFPYNDLRHPNMKLWIQSPDPARPVRANRFIPVGYPCDFQENLQKVQKNLDRLGATKETDVFFAGQVTHQRRYECVAALKTLPSKMIVETQQFYSGIPHYDYAVVLAMTKIAPCPSGPVCSDTFRLAEALETGCIPIVDEWPGWKVAPTTGFWDILFKDRPFPLIGNWADAPKVIESLLVDYDRHATNCRNWWSEYKAKYFSWLGEDLKELGVNIA